MIKILQTASPLGLNDNMMAKDDISKISFSFYIMDIVNKLK